MPPGNCLGKVKLVSVIGMDCVCHSVSETGRQRISHDVNEFLLPPESSGKDIVTLLLGETVVCTFCVKSGTTG